MDSEVIKELIKLEEKLEYCFIDRELLKQSLTHPAVNPVRNFEPLEFLGDSLLGSCLAVLIYNRIQTTDEGLLSR
ncbi:MAG: ribonuclease III, partial [Deltaproteobacteria bacterium]|nr:ribonuclease III [Deltaproteobacteria bacterium]